MDGMPVRAFIVGSCVSRDALSKLQPGYTVGAYVARQSVISAGTTVSQSLLDADRVTSRFQLRNLRGDLAGDAAQRLGLESDAIDVVLWDLVDERNGVYRAGEGWFTNNWELRRTGAIDELTRFDLLRFGTDEHFEEWRIGARRFAELLESEGLRERTIVVAPAMATLFEDGTPLANVVAGFGSDYGPRFDRYADYLEHELGFTAVRPSVEVVRAGSDHRWGRAPYHYSDETEQLIADLISQLVRENGWDSESNKQVGWSLELPDGATSAEVSIRLSTEIARHDFLVEVHAYDAAGGALSRQATEWPYSQYVGANYRYLDAGTEGSRQTLELHNLDSAVANLRFAVRNWKDQQHLVRKVVAGVDGRDDKGHWSPLPRTRIS